MLVNILIIMSLVLVINYLLYNFLYLCNTYKMFECGFDMMFWVHPKLSVHFFKIGIIFVLFDLELMLLFLSFTKFIMFIWVLMMFIYFSIFMEMFLEGFKWAMLSLKS